MGFWSIVQPQAITNIVTNPSFETNTNGWVTIIGGSIARVNTTQRRGAWCLAVTPSSSTNDGVALQTLINATVSGQVHAVSFDFKGVSGVPYQATINVGGSGSVAFIGDGAWHRYSFLFTTTGTGVAMRIQKAGSASTATYYIDGVQIALASADTTYCDGDQDGCQWNGTPHASNSSRGSQSRAGGQVLNFDALGITIGLNSQGLGMPPMDVVSLQAAQANGATYQASYAKERPIMLAESINGTSQSNLHSLRKAMIDLIKPDAVATPQPVQLRYNGTGGGDMLLNAVYADGLKWQGQSGFGEDAPLQMVAHDPYWAADYNEGAQLTNQASISVNYLLQRSAAGAWSTLGSGLNGEVNAILVVSANEIYAGGAFTIAGGTTVNYVARWNGTAWAALGTGPGANGVVYSLALGPDGRLYAGGAFSLMTGYVNTAYIAVYNAGSSSWQALGTGMNNTVYGIAFGPDGTLYATGDFTTAGGTAANYIAKWDGSTWAALGSGLGANGNDIATGIDGSIYVVGTFTTAGGSSANRVAKWTPSSSSWSALGSGLAGGAPSTSGHKLAIGPDGRVYVGGNFATAGGVSSTGIAVWNGTAWASLGGVTFSGTPTIYAAEWIGDMLYLGGRFTKVGSVTLIDGIATWNGSQWQPVDIDQSTSPGGAKSFASVNSQLFVGIVDTGTSTTAAATTITNTGTASADPIFKLTNSDTVARPIYSLKNVTTDKVIYFKNLNVLPGEIITIDLRYGRKSITSNLRGNLLAYVLEASNFATFQLLPGANIISAFAYSTVTIVAYWRPRYWSIDGSAA